MAPIGDYKMAAVEAAERDRSRAVDEAYPDGRPETPRVLDRYTLDGRRMVRHLRGMYVRFLDHQRAVSAAVEERDRQWRERIEAEIERLTESARIRRLQADEKQKEQPTLAETLRTRAVKRAWAAVQLRSLLSPVPEIPGLEGTRDRVDGLMGATAPAATTSVSGKSTVEEGENK